MNLEELQSRSIEIANSIENMTQQVFVLQGHKNEVDYHIKLAHEKLDAENQPAIPPVDEVVIEDESEPTEA